MISARVHVLSCVNASSRAQTYPVAVLEIRAEQLNPAKGSPQENMSERVPGGRRTHPGPDGQITRD